MNIRVLRYLAMDLPIPQFLFIRRWEDSRDVECFCTLCKKVTPHWNTGNEASSSYQWSVSVKCHGKISQVSLTDGILEKCELIYREVYQP